MKNNWQVALALFQMCDVNMDGNISVSECARLTELLTPATKKKCEALLQTMAQMDGDTDDLVSLEHWRCLSRDN